MNVNLDQQVTSRNIKNKNTGGYPFMMLIASPENQDKEESSYLEQFFTKKGQY